MLIGGKLKQGNSKGVEIVKGVSEDLAKWEQAVEFHGHICPGLTVGYKASIYGLKLLGLEGKNIGNTHYAIVENDVCGLDGVQIVTGCTIGNDSLIINNLGKKAFSFVDKKTGTGVRVLLNVPLWGEYKQAIHLHHQVKNNTATADEKAEFFRVREQRGRELLEYTDELMFTWENTNVIIPSKPRLHEFARCEICKEEAMLPWIKLKDGLKVCSKCYHLE